MGSSDAMGGITVSLRLHLDLVTGLREIALVNALPVADTCVTRATHDLSISSKKKKSYKNAFTRTMHLALHAD